MVAMVRSESVWLRPGKMLLLGPQACSYPYTPMFQHMWLHRDTTWRCMSGFVRFLRPSCSSPASGSLPVPFLSLSILFFHSISIFFQHSLHVRHLSRGYNGDQDCDLTRLMFYGYVKVGVIVGRLKQIIQSRDNLGMMSTMKIIKHSHGRESNWTQRSMKPSLKKIFGIKEIFCTEL